ncbi:hypothetical protein [Glycomyces halotolerans]
MAESTPNKARKIWRGVLAGAAAVPLAVFAATPAVGVAAPVEAEPVQSEQVPSLPDPIEIDLEALVDLQLCLADLQVAVEALVGASPDPGALPGETEQLPELPGVEPPEVPDVGALTETCQTVLEIVLSLSGEVPPEPVEPIEPIEPVEPVEPVEPADPGA